MTSVAVAVSIAFMLTSIFAFRFREQRRPGLLALYFLLFLVVETVVGRAVLPPDALGPEVAVVCTGIAVLFVVASIVAARIESSDDRSR